MLWCHSRPPGTLPGVEETEDLNFDASADDVKSALEALSNVGTVNVTRDESDGGGLYSWRITFVEPIMSALSSVDQNGDAGGSSAILLFPLLYAGGEENDAAPGLGTLGAGGEFNVTRLHRGTLGSLSGEVSTGCLRNAWHFVFKRGALRVHEQSFCRG